MKSRTIPSKREEFQFVAGVVAVQGREGERGVQEEGERERVQEKEEERGCRERGRERMQEEGERGCKKRMRENIQQTLKHPEQHKVQQLHYNNTHTTTHSTYSTSTCHLSPVQSVGFSSGTTTIG